jgi:hypothetical protein
MKQSEMHETLGEVFGYKENGESLISNLAFIGKQLERIANSLEQRK